MEEKTGESYQTVVLYHSADFDGIFCREVARKFLGDKNVKYYGWNYYDPVPEIPPENRVYMLDISIPELMNHPRLTWIDHHKTAMEKYPETIPGYRIDGVAACRLAWQWFTVHEHNAQNERNDQMMLGFPDKQAYIDHQVIEPFAVRLAGEYDVFDHRDERAKLFQHGLRSEELTPEIWCELLDPKATIGYAGCVQHLLFQGRGIQYFQQNSDKFAIQKCGYVSRWWNINFLMCNWGARGFNSLSFAGFDFAGKGKDVEALLGYRFSGKIWEVSLYHHPGHEDIDLTAIVKRYGGGGHKGACGFSIDWLPFTPFQAANPE